MDGIRLNMSHTTLEESAYIIETCFAAAADQGVAPEFMIDMQGPELRIGTLSEPLHFAAGEAVGTDSIPFTQVVRAEILRCPPGQEILLDDGKILLRTERTGSETCLRVIRGGILTGRKSVALPGCVIQSPAMTEPDKKNIRDAKKFGVTAVMQPFVRSRDDLIEVRKALDNADGSDILLSYIDSNAAAGYSLAESVGSALRETADGVIDGVTVTRYEDRGEFVYETEEKDFSKMFISASVLVLLTAAVVITAVIIIGRYRKKRRLIATEADYRRETDEDPADGGQSSAGANTPVTCPNCGATAYPDDRGCCQFCGAPLRF